jgi:hypothetical protein
MAQGARSRLFRAVEAWKGECEPQSEGYKGTDYKLQV